MSQYDEYNANIPARVYPPAKDYEFGGAFREGIARKAGYRLAKHERDIEWLRDMQQRHGLEGAEKGGRIRRVKRMQKENIALQKIGWKESDKAKNAAKRPKSVGILASMQAFENKLEAGNERLKNMGFQKKTEYQCDTCEATHPRANIVVKKATFLELGRSGKKIRTRTTAYMCRDCMNGDEDFNIKAYDRLESINSSQQQAEVI